MTKGDIYVQKYWDDKDVHKNHVKKTEGQKVTEVLDSIKRTKMKVTISLETQDVVGSWPLLNKLKMKTKD